jgi:hypothetical protein
MNCPKCGQSVSNDARFCGKCGSQVGLGARVGDFGLAIASASGAGAAPIDGPRALPGLIERVKNIILMPRTEWHVIAAEPTSIGQLYTGYVMPLAAFAAVMSFIRMSVIGVNLPFGGAIRTPMVSGLFEAVVTFILGLIGLYLVGLIINMLAPMFSAERNQRQALQTAAYALTPAWLGTALTFLPLGTLLQLIAGLYGIYVLYLGLPVMMRAKRNDARHDASGYTAAVVVCTILLGILFAVVGAALGGDVRHEPVDFNTLKSMLPASLPQMQRTDAQGSNQQALGVKSSSASADYQGAAAGTANPRMRIKISDMSGVSGLLDAAGGLVPAGETQSDTGFEKDTVLDGRAVHEKYDRSSGAGEVSALIAKRFSVEVTGQGVDMTQLEKTLSCIDLARLESMRDAGAQAAAR